MCYLGSQGRDFDFTSIFKQFLCELKTLCESPPFPSFFFPCIQLCLDLILIMNKQSDL